MNLKIGEKDCSSNNPLYIAEEGQANQGDIDLAFQMIDTAAMVGADGIEFQLFCADDMYVKGHRGHVIYRKAELSKAQIKSLITYTKEKGIIFQAACLSVDLVGFCAQENVDAFVINATDLNNPQILDAVSDTKIPFWLATLMGSEGEIDWAIDYLNNRGAINFGILHGQHVMSSGDYMGVPPEMAQLGCIAKFQDRYGVPVGYVDHSPTVHMPALAVSSGAALVTKHLAPEENWEGPDAAVALASDAWGSSRELFHYAKNCLGDSKELSQSEIKDRSIHRRGLYTTKQLKKGDLISPNDLIALRPGKDAINPRQLSDIIGKKITQTIPQNHLLSFSDFK